MKEIDSSLESYRLWVDELNGILIKIRSKTANTADDFTAKIAIINRINVGIMLKTQLHEEATICRRRKKITNEFTKLVIIGDRLKEEIMADIMIYTLTR